MSEITTIESLSRDCLQQIFLHVPQLPFGALPQVCRAWNNVLTDLEMGAYPILAGNYSQIPVIQIFMPTQSGLSGFQRINQTINKIKTAIFIISTFATPVAALKPLDFSAIFEPTTLFDFAA